MLRKSPKYRLLVGLISLSLMLGSTLPLYAHACLSEDSGHEQSMEDCSGNEEKTMADHHEDMMMDASPDSSSENHQEEASMLICCAPNFVSLNPSKRELIYDLTLDRTLVPVSVLDSNYEPEFSLGQRVSDHTFPKPSIPLYILLGKFLS